MAALDTNILVRFLVRDDEGQWSTAKRLIRRCIEAGEPLYVPVTVALELEWVLSSNFAMSKADIVQKLSDLLSAHDLTFESEGALELALRHYADSSADYSDCVHVALVAQAGHSPLWTFGKAASKVEGAQLLTPARLAG